MPGMPCNTTANINGESLMILKTNSLPPTILNIIRDKGTETPFSCELNTAAKTGSYLCRQCGQALFRTSSEFHSGCGWPSFDAEVPNAVKQQPDADGKRTEILCNQCSAHLGHVFQGEKFTAKDTRYCVNGLSLEFVEEAQILHTEEAIFAAGCFWGVEYYFKKLPGVLKTEVGYSGGRTQNPNYQQVCAGNTGHLEVIRVLFDPQKINYQKIVRYFFEIHDFTQTDGQGPDLGEQYLSAIFYFDASQEKVANDVISALEKKGHQIATQLLPVAIFWPAETYHQDYYQKNSKQPYCHRWQKLFD